MNNKTLKNKTTSSNKKEIEKSDKKFVISHSKTIKGRISDTPYFACESMYESRYTGW